MHCKSPFWQNFTSLYFISQYIISLHCFLHVKLPADLREPPGPLGMWLARMKGKWLRKCEENPWRVEGKRELRVLGGRMDWRGTWGRRSWGRRKQKIEKDERVSVRLQLSNYRENGGDEEEGKQGSNFWRGADHPSRTFLIRRECILTTLEASSSPGQI